MKNRARFIILETKAKARDTVAARLAYDDIFEPLGGFYAGWISHPYGRGPHPAHFYLFEEPSASALGGLIRLARDGTVDGLLMRDRFAEGEVEYDLDQIMLDISKALHGGLQTTPVDSQTFARCWEGVKVLEAMVETIP